MWHWLYLDSELWFRVSLLSLTSAHTQTHTIFRDHEFPFTIAYSFFSEPHSSASSRRRNKFIYHKSTIEWHVCNQIQFSCSVISDSLQPHGLQHAKFPCPLPTPRAYSNSCPSSWWCHPTISSSVVPFFSCLQSFPASGSFLINQLFATGGQSIGASASVLPMNIRDWFPLGWTGLISLQSKGLSRIFSNTTVQKHQFFGA